MEKMVQIFPNARSRIALAVVACVVATGLSALPANAAVNGDAFKGTTAALFKDLGENKSGLPCQTMLAAKGWKYTDVSHKGQPMNAGALQGAGVDDDAGYFYIANSFVRRQGQLFKDVTIGNTRNILPLTAGDLCISRVAVPGKGDPRNNSWMLLKDFGHGNQIGVVPSGVKTDINAYIWTDVGRPKGGSFGTDLARIKFKPNTIVYPSDATVGGNCRYSVGATDKVQVTVDVPGSTLVVRLQRKASPVLVYKFYRLGDLRKSTCASSATFTGAQTGIIADPEKVVSSDPIQGMAKYGSFLYVLRGGVRGPDNPTATAHVSRLQIATKAGAVNDRLKFNGAPVVRDFVLGQNQTCVSSKTQCAGNASWKFYTREPENLFVHYDPAIKEYRLVAGFNTATVAKPTDNTSTWYSMT